MVAFTSPNLMRWIAPTGAILAGIVVAGAFMLMPAGMLEDWVSRSGIAALVPVAQPPLGTTARAVLALAGGLLSASVVWSALFLLFGADGFVSSRLAARAVRPVRDEGVPVVRRADAHPDAPARRPLSVSDLGAPMPPVTPPAVTTPPAPVKPPVVQSLPADLDQPLAAFDPAALPPVPREPVRPVTPLKAPVLAAGERFESVELPRAPRAKDAEPSIEALLRRLEQSARPRRAAHG